MPKPTVEYVLSHAEDVAKRVAELEEENAALRIEITTRLQLAQGAKQWWQKLGLG